MPKTRDEKRKAFTDGKGNLKAKRLIPAPGGAMELAIVDEGANGRLVLVAKSDERPAVTAARAPTGADTAQPTVKTKGGTSTADSRLPETADNPIGAGLDLTVPEPKVSNGDPGPELPAFTDEADEALAAAKGKTAWQRFKSLLGALVGAGDELEGAEAAAKADADEYAPDFNAVIAAVEAVGIARMAENALYDTICNVAWSYDLTVDEKKAALRDAAQAFAVYVSEKLKTDGVPKDFGTKLKTAFKAAQAAAEPQIREAIKAEFPEVTESTTEDDMNEAQVKDIAAKAAQEAVAPVVEGIAKLTEALKAAGLPDGVFQAQFAQMPGNGGGASPDQTVEGAVREEPTASAAMKTDGGKPAGNSAAQPTMQALLDQVGALGKQVQKLRSTVLPANGEGGGGSGQEEEPATVLDAFEDFDTVSRQVVGG